MNTQERKGNQLKVAIGSGTPGLTAIAPELPKKRAAAWTSPALLR